MKFYTIGRVVNECCGHGDFRFSTQIRQDFGKRGDDFPPLFKTKDAAVEYMKSAPKWINHVVVVFETNEE